MELKLHNLLYILQAHSHATSALESNDIKSKAEAYYIRAGILKDMDELDRAEEVEVFVLHIIMYGHSVHV